MPSTEKPSRTSVWRLSGPSLIHQLVNHRRDLRTDAPEAGRQTGEKASQVTASVVMANRVAGRTHADSPAPDSL